MSKHKPVLLEEVIEGLSLNKGNIVVDATLGGGGHSKKILKVIGENGKLIAFDRDSEAISKFEIKIKKENKNNVVLVHENFKNIDKILKDLNIKKVDAILADFGISSDQLEVSERGFSFNKKEPLDMRMNSTKGKSAKDIVNEYEEKDLVDILQKYGEEKFARKIVKKIITSREGKLIETTTDLVDIIKEAIPKKYQHQRVHFATKTFQALRIEVNEELKSIEEFLFKAIDCLKSGGRLAVISFHSGEDRIAKKIFKSKALDCVCPPELPVCQCDKESELKIITKKPIIPSEKEVQENPRSRSAKLRVVEKI